MSTQLNQNTTDLQSILDVVNALPDAGYDKDEVDAATEDIATAITNKGVEVPSGTTLDGMAALIDGIETGGGVETCTLTLNIQKPNPNNPTSTHLYCVLADGSYEWPGCGYESGSSYVYTLPKPCCIGLCDIISISGDYEQGWMTNDVYYIYGDVTVEGYYEGVL